MKMFVLGFWFWLDLALDYVMCVLTYHGHQVRLELQWLSFLRMITLYVPSTPVHLFVHCISLGNYLNRWFRLHTQPEDGRK